jgi:NADPH:quinone reductase
MKAVALTHYLPISNPDALVDIDLVIPTPLAHDVLIKVHAISVNPVDTKVRKPKDKIEVRPRVLGWDAAGEVVAIGDAVTLFKPGDAVYYAGDIARSGCNAEYQIVDERIVGRKPKSLSFEAAAALPLTAITAWEALFDRLEISLTPSDNINKTLLIINAAGGVGSIAIQLAKQVTGLQVIATASRPETVNWVKSLGADVVVNHRALELELKQQQITPDYILCNHDTDGYFALMAHLIKPQGKICSIVETANPVDLDLLKSKSATFVWEFMFTRSMYQTKDMIAQHHILQKIAQLVDDGTIKTTLNQVLKPINAENLRLAHAAIETNTTIGKLVLSGW